MGAAADDSIGLAVMEGVGGGGVGWLLLNVFMLNSQCKGERTLADLVTIRTKLVSVFLCFWRTSIINTSVKVLSRPGQVCPGRATGLVLAGTRPVALAQPFHINY